MNPNPAVWANDDGSVVFGHANLSLAIEQAAPIRDNPPNLPIFFGFYFDGTNPTGTGSDGRPNAAPVFDNGDQVGNRALLDFPNGVVYDLETTTVQSSFTKTPAGTGDIGFYISVLYPNATSFTTFYTDPALNPGAFDLAATFPALADPTRYLVSFDIPAGPNSFTLAYSVYLTDLTVPEPSSVALLGLALLLLTSFTSVRRRGSRL